MKENQTISECPVCHSHDIQQQLANQCMDTTLFVYGTGSHCKNCGVKFAFNTPRLNHEIEKEKAFLKDAVGKAKCR